MANVPKPSIPLIAPSEWTPEARDAYAALDSSATEGVGPASNMAMTLAHHPRLAKSYYTLGKYLGVDSTLPARLREIATLRVAWRLKSEYEWNHHVRFAKKLGMSREEIEAVRQGPDAAVWSAQDACVLRVVDELFQRNEIDDATWRELNERLPLQQVMDLVFTIGHYVMTAWALSAFNIGIEAPFKSVDHPL